MKTKKENTTALPDYFLYEKILNEFKELINSGSLKYGEKLPSVRQYSMKKKISVSTVLKVYRMLEDEGLIETKPKSGYFVKKIPQQLYPKPELTEFAPSISNVNVYDLYSELADNLNDEEMIQLGTAVPNLDYFPVKKFGKIITSIIRTKGISTNKYTSPKGMDELIHKISKRAFEHGEKLSEKEIIITNGCTEALNLCLRAVTEPGDTVIVESPTYYGFLEIAESLKLKIIEIPTDPETGIGLDRLNSVLKKVKAKVLLINPNFQNPLGHSIPDINKKELVSLLAEKEIPIIEDDVYTDLYWGNSKPSTIKSFDKSDNVLLCSSFSKILAPGYRVGYVAAGKYFQNVKKNKLSTSFHSNILPQMAVSEFMNNGGYELHLRNLRRKYKEQVYSYLNLLSQKLPKGSKISRPAGGYVLWIELPGKVDTIDLFKKTIKDKITISPGSMFSATGKYQNCFRFNCSFPIDEKINRAVDKVCRYAKELY